MLLVDTQGMTAAQAVTAHSAEVLQALREFPAAGAGL